jgi:ADP-heptose:LPS heptosyltransferase
MVGREQTETNDLSIMETAQQNILIVKLGAFGNIILSLAAFAAIRRHHAGARISVLTSATYAAWLRTFPYFDESLVDRRPAGWDFQTVHQFGRMLANGHFGRVDDLQTSTRSSPPNLVYLPVESVLESLTA